MLFTLFLALLGVVAADDLGCSGSVNDLDIVDQKPIFLKANGNGKLFMIDGNGLIDPPLYIAHLYGTPYEMGWAYGDLLQSQVQTLVNETFEYFYEEIGNYIQWLSPELQKVIETDGVEYILDYVYDLARPHIAERFIHEMEGLADGALVSRDDIKKISMIPEAIKASCSMVGAWQTAVSDGVSLVQLRALDWDTNGPFQQFPVVLNYHPSTIPEGGFDFSVLTWAGLVGSITGYSSSQVAICEKVWISYDGKDNRRGNPFTFVLRDILQYDSTREEAIKRVEDAKRTCSIWGGVGDNWTNEMNVLEYDYENVTVFTSDTYPVYDSHPHINDVIYVDKHVQPSSDPCLANLLKAGHGTIDAKYLFQSVAARLQTGDMHVAIYDYNHQLMYVSNAEVFVEGQPQKKAFERNYVQLDMNALWNEKLL